MGEHDIYNDREPFAMEGRKLRQVLVHPNFDPSSFENDLALLQMASPVSYQANILPACLPQKGEYKRGTTGWVTGWGRMKIGELRGKAEEIQYINISRWTSCICSTGVGGSTHHKQTV